MDFESDVNTQQLSDPQQGISSYLDSADEAREAGQARLAVHLYCAAFELAIEQGLAPTERILDGMNHAWLLACEQGDHSSAESIFHDLLPYHSPEQTEEALKQLKELAVHQLEDFGLTHEEIAQFAQTLTQEAQLEGSAAETFAAAERQEITPARIIEPESAADTTNIASAADTANTTNATDATSAGNAANTAGLTAENTSEIKSITRDIKNATKLNLNRIFDNLEIHLAELNKVGGVLAAADGASSSDTQVQDEQVLRYEALTGYKQAVQSMRQFGFTTAADAQFKDFIKQANNLHGVSGPVLTDSFFFHGSNREDLALFAKATAVEIGWPFIEIIVEFEGSGGTIKVVGPTKRSVFGPPRLADLPHPCTLIVQNIDLLQELFRREEQAISQGQRFGYTQGEYGASSGSQGFNPHGTGGVMPQRSMQADVLGHLTTLCAYGEVFVIGTSVDAPSQVPALLGEGLLDVLGSYREIEIASPDVEEREEILRYFAKEHPSFKGINFAQLAELSQDVARNELVWAAQGAVEDAYRESLRTGLHRMVSLSDVLSQLRECFEEKSPQRAHIEDTIVAQFRSEIDNDLSNL
ncbi:MAG: hypothetical protein FWG00_04630 [Coriobacteriia bacterium]|nr:hypothetical protein [Coriobacteriia bacterium]